MIAISSHRKLLSGFCGSLKVHVQVTNPCSKYFDDPPQHDFVGVNAGAKLVTQAILYLRAQLNSERYVIGGQAVLPNIEDSFANKWPRLNKRLDLPPAELANARQVQREYFQRRNLILNMFVWATVIQVQEGSHAPMNFTS